MYLTNDTRGLFEFLKILQTFKLTLFPYVALTQYWNVATAFFWIQCLTYFLFLVAAIPTFTQCVKKILHIKLLASTGFSLPRLFEKVYSAHSNERAWIYDCPDTALKLILIFYLKLLSKIHYTANYVRRFQETLDFNTNINFVWEIF